jgi:hypothetical protein
MDPACRQAGLMPAWIAARFEELEDPRMDRTKDHKLSDILASQPQSQTDDVRLGP